MTEFEREQLIRARDALRAALDTLEHVEDTPITPGIVLASTLRDGHLVTGRVVESGIPCGGGHAPYIVVEWSDGSTARYAREEGQ